MVRIANCKLLIEGVLFIGKENNRNEYEKAAVNGRLKGRASSACVQ